jgi:hypothetical protein
MIDVKSILRLSREFIKSAEFDKWHFDQLPIFNTNEYGWKSISNERNKYLENYRFINKGSGRFVYEISPTTALKVAKDRLGIIQNKIEFSVLKRGAFSNALPKIFDRSEDYSWIEVELATPLKNLDEIEEMTGIDRRDFDNLISLVKNRNSFKELIQFCLKTTDNPHLLERYSKYLNNSFLNKVDEICKIFNLYPSEVAKRSSLGKSASGNIVFLDVGIMN